MNAHTAEMARLQTLLIITQGKEERSRLTSELERVSNITGLEGMEEALHMEVCTIPTPYPR